MLGMAPQVHRSGRNVHVQEIYVLEWCFWFWGLSRLWNTQHFGYSVKWKGLSGQPGGSVALNDSAPQVKHNSGHQTQAGEKKMAERPCASWGLPERVRDLHTDPQPCALPLARPSLPAITLSVI